MCVCVSERERDRERERERERERAEAGRPDAAPATECVLTDPSYQSGR